MPPIFLLVAVCIISAVAMAADVHRRGQIHKKLRALAGRQGMHFSIADQLRLTPRVAASIPVPGAASVHVHDLLYASDSGQRRYIFTVEYTTGVVQWKKRVRCVAAFSEPRERTSTDAPCTIQLAPPDSGLLEQYQYLMATH